MFRAIFAAAERFCRDERGAVLPMFTVVMIALLLVTAVGIDYGNALVVKQKLISAADAAALAVGADPQLTDEEADAKAEAYIRAHYPDADFGTLVDFNVVATSSDVDVTVSARIPTTFLKVARIDTIDIQVHSQVKRHQRDLELVMVLDNTGSMDCSGWHCVSKMDNLKTAANKLVTILFGEDPTSEHVKIGLVPFSGAVNIGTDKAGSGWLDETGAAYVHDEDIDLPHNTTLLDLFDEITNVSWGGCVRARIDSSRTDLDLTDTAPSASNADTLWVPYFAPDEPGNGDGPGDYSRDHSDDYYFNNYIDNDHFSCRRCSDLEERTRIQRDADKYSGASVGWNQLNNNPPLGPNFNCVPQKIQELTNVKSTITTAIQGMQPQGSTVIPAGLSWGWKVVSPGAPYTEGAAYTDERVAKAIILLTDGRNQVEGNIGHNNSFYSAYGYAAEGHLGDTDGSDSRDVLDEKTTALCNAIKANKDDDDDLDIYVYTITFDVSDWSTRNLMRDCATPDEDCPGETCYFNSPTGAALENAFESIALGLNKLRVAK
jgi:Flp pilus assembly protein TadG